MEMIGLKRMSVVVVVLMLAAGGIMTVHAASGTQDQMALQQEEGAAWLGITVVDTDDGVAVRMVMPDSPADEAGLQRGDIIEAVDGTAVESAEALVEVIGAHAPGDEIVLTVSSGGESREVPVTLAERPDEIEIVKPPLEYGFEMGPHAGMFSMLGLDITVTDEGLKVDAIAEDSPLAESGLQVGDVITQINGEPVVERRPGVIHAFRFDKPVVLTVLRGGEEVEITVDVESLGWPMELGVMPMVPGMDYGFAMGRPTQLGVSFQTLNAEIAAEEGLPVEQGARIEEVFEDTPAAEAGLQIDDIITAVAGEPVDEERTLLDRLYAYEEGDTVTLTVLRGGEELQIDVTLGPKAMMGPFFGGPNMFFMGLEGMKGFFGGRFHMGEGFPFMGPQGGMFDYDFGAAESAPAPDGPSA
jgi:S1-C subfamily serine protease